MIARPAGLAAVLLVGLLAAGCGSSVGASSTSSTTRSFAAFTACLKQHGVKSPGGGFRGGGPPSGSPPSGGQRPNISPKLHDAIAACQSVRPQGGQGGFGGPPGGS